MKSTTVTAITGMSGAMVAAIIGTLLVCLLVTLKLESARELPRDFKRLDREIQQAQDLIAEYKATPVVPPLEETWREVVATIQLAGIYIQPDDGSMANGSVSTYEGPLKYWGGLVIGDVKTVLAVLKRTQEKHPIFMLDYSVADGEIRMYVAVVGI